MDINRMRMSNVRKTKEGKNPYLTFTFELNQRQTIFFYDLHTVATIYVVFIVVGTF